jgi:outer membrane protein insertion porin family
VETLRITGLGALLSLLVALAGRVPAAAQPAPVAPSEPVAPSAPAEPAPTVPADAGPAAIDSVPAAAAAIDTAPAAAALPPPPAAPAPPVAADGGATAAGFDSEPPAPGRKLVYVLERIDIRGNTTRAAVIRRFVPLQPGDALDVDDPAIEQIRFRLMGTGWFNEVHLRLQRGAQHGHVVLVVEAQERNTLVVSRVIAGLSRVVTRSTSTRATLRPYAGLGLTESNLLGLGIGVGASAVVSNSQFGFDLRYHDPMFTGSSFDLNARAFYNHAREFFGRHPTVFIDCPVPDPAEPNPQPCDPDVLSKRAVVIYNRGGFGFGTGHDITSALRYEIDWLGEIVHVGAKPLLASTLLGAQNQEWAPIDFRIDDATSRVSSLHLGLILDRRDDPALPSQGQLLRLDARMGSGLLGSTYDFARLEASFRHYQPLPWGHVISLGAYLGTVFGRAPFFYLFYAADLSDLLPARALELNLDQRRTHNLLGTSIREFDKEDLASRIDFEYELPLHRGGGDIRGVHAYAGAGLFLLADRSALRLGIPGYTGLSRIPVDLTFDLGVQADTVIGVFKIGFSSLIGFLPDLGRGR